MTEKQRGIYLLFCMAGRTSEAEEYKAECEAKAAEAKLKPGPVSSPEKAEDDK